MRRFSAPDLPALDRSTVACPTVRIAARCRPELGGGCADVEEHRLGNPSRFSVTVDTLRGPELEGCTCATTTTPVTGLDPAAETEVAPSPEVAEGPRPGSGPKTGFGRGIDLDHWLLHKAATNHALSEVGFRDGHRSLIRRPSRPTTAPPTVSTSNR